MHAQLMTPARMLSSFTLYCRHPCQVLSAALPPAPQMSAAAFFAYNRLSLSVLLMLDAVRGRSL
eukprot:6183725-Pleurochrysis_carterae.AAC.2